MSKSSGAFFSFVLAKYKEFILVSSVLFIFLVVFFNKTIFLGQIPSPQDLLTFWPVFSSNQSTPIQNMLMFDVIVQHELWLHYNMISIHEFTLPLWNPYSGCGVPHIANMQSSFFYPPSWFMHLLGFKIGLLLYYFTKLYLAGIFTYYYLRSIKIDFLPSLIGSTAFMFCGYNIVWLYWPLPNPIFVLPLILFLIEKLIQDTEGKGLYFIAYSVAIALGIFAGHPETFFYIAVISFLYFMFRLIVKKKAMIADKIKIMRNYVFFSLLGIALSAVQLLPFLEYLFNSYTWGARGAYRCILDWHTAILNMVPTFYGSPSIYHKIPCYIPFPNYNESAAGYVGISMLIFAVLALITKYKDNLVRFYLLLSIWAMGVIYGIPLIFDFTVSLPLFSHAANTRLLFLLGFNVVVLGTIGLNKLLEEVREDNKRYILNRSVISVLMVLLVLFALAYANRGFLYMLSSLNEDAIRTQNILVLLTCMVILLTFILIYILVKYAHNPRLKTACLVGLLLFVFIQTGIYGMLYEPAIEEKYNYPKAEAFDLIKDKTNLYRVTSVDNCGSVYPVNTQMSYGIYDIRNYDAIEIRYYWDLLNVFAEGRIYGWVDLFNVDKRFLDFTGVKWIFSRDDLSNVTGITLFKKYPGYNLFENKDAQQRAFVVQNAVFKSRDSDVLNELKNKSLDWRSAVVISGRNHTVQYPPSENNVRIINYKPTYIKINVNTAHPGFLVLSDSYYPGWNAYINGSRTDILRANYAFRAVELPKGENVVEFKYEPLSFYVGGLISLMGLIVLAIVTSKSFCQKTNKKR